MISRKDLRDIAMKLGDFSRTDLVEWAQERGVSEDAMATAVLMGVQVQEALRDGEELDEETRFALMDVAAAAFVVGVEVGRRTMGDNGEYPLSSGLPDPDSAVYRRAG